MEENRSKILVFGAGPLGSFFASRLAEAGHDVSILARKKRLADLKVHGIILVDAFTKKREVKFVPVVESLEPDDNYELILVVMRKNQALNILPILSKNRRAKTILFLMNNAAGPGELIDVLGSERVMIGFPSAAGYLSDEVVHIMTVKAMAVPIGEVDGSITARTRQVASILNSIRDKKVEIRTDMDAWLVSHIPALLGVFGIYATGVDPVRFARTPDAIVLGLRAREEAFKAQVAAGIPVRPIYLKALLWIPEPLAFSFIKKMATSTFFEVGIFGHGANARDEIQHLIKEFKKRVEPGGVKTPALDELTAYLNELVPPMPLGRKDLPLRWGGILAIGLTVFGISALVKIKNRRNG